MGRDDWDLYFKAMQSNTGQAARIKDKTPMTRGTDATDGMKITVGDVTATIYLMPGHTPGSLGMIVPVKFHGKEHPILLLTAATDFHNRDAFVGGYEHIWDIGIQDKVESVMQVHPNTNMNILARMKYVNDNYPPATNPLLYGAARTERYINIMRACSQARMAALGW
jgi:metallo-beta-lactamase class B